LLRLDVLDGQANDHSPTAGTPSPAWLPASPSPPLSRRKCHIPYTGLVQGLDIAIICVLTIGISGTLAASFGVFAGTAALFMFGEVPRVRRDILQQIPGLDTYYDRRIAPEDNVSPAPLVFLSLAICLLILALLNYLRSYLERPC
jgi:hypothetical protein